MRHFTLLRPEEGDWEALYMDGQLLLEGHSICVADVLEALSDVFPNELDIISIPDENAEAGFSVDLNDMFKS